MRILILSAALALGTPAFADSDMMGDPEAGERLFKGCKACHAIINTETDEVIYKGGKTGPNLYGVIGSVAGTYEGYKYGKSIVAAGEAGLKWDAETFTAFVQDPKGYLRTYLDDSKAKSKMSFKLKKGAEDVLAYLISVGPEKMHMMEDGEMMDGEMMEEGEAAESN